jgi:glutamate/tyrosine decarboxylase-like PLP-dependent enzyme
MADDAADRLARSLFPYRDRFPTYRTIPPEGRPRDEILAMLTEMATEEDHKGDAGRVSGSIYHGDHEHYGFLTEAFGAFAHANVLQRDMYPSATKLEGEIIAMTAAMLHGEAAEDVCGVLTSGGTESLINPMLVYRERARVEKGITSPEVVLPVTAHTAFHKACHYFGITPRLAPLADDYRVDVGAVAGLITPNTVALVGSAGNYPHGLIDPIDELSELALEHDLGLHVDGCLGGFILPWGQRLGYDIPVFDFRLPGVTSISADTHKFGYALKGTSVLLYRTKHLRRYQYFTFPDWPGGLYVSPGLSGSRSGGLIAATWAAMVSLGEEGYLATADAIFRTAAVLRDGIASTPGLRVIGDPTFLVAFTSDDLDIFHVNDHLVERGWRMNGLQLPKALHFCVTRPNTLPGVVDAFLDDLRDGVAHALVATGEPRSGALYGIGGTPEGNAVMHELQAGYLDMVHEVAP